LTEAVRAAGMIERKTIRLVGIGRVAKGVRQKNALSPASSLVPNNLPVPCQLIVTAKLSRRCSGKRTASESQSGPNWWWSCANATAAFAAAGNEPSMFPGVAGALMSAP
jgi:hypothetical protein